MASLGVVIMLLITDNTNVESRTQYVVKCVINNIMSTALTGQRKTATYLHLVRELLYNFEWPSRRQLRIGILCTYRHWSEIFSLPLNNKVIHTEVIFLNLDRPPGGVPVAA